MWVGLPACLAASSRTFHAILEIFYTVFVCHNNKNKWSAFKDKESPHFCMSWRIVFLLPRWQSQMIDAQSWKENVWTWCDREKKEREMNWNDITTQWSWRQNNQPNFCHIFSSHLEKRIQKYRCLNIESTFYWVFLGKIKWKMFNSDKVFWVINEYWLLKKKHFSVVHFSFIPMQKEHRSVDDDDVDTR